DISSWDVSSVNSMIGMFDSTVHFNQDISSWDVRNVKLMNSMFESAEGFNQDISNWELSNLERAFAMFRYSAMNCMNYSKTLRGWAYNPNTAHNVDMTSNFEMFYSPSIIDNRNYLINNLGWSISGDNLGSCILSIKDYGKELIYFYP